MSVSREDLSLSCLGEIAKFVKCARLTCAFSFLFECLGLTIFVLVGLSDGLLGSGIGGLREGLDLFGAHWLLRAGCDRWSGFSEFAGLSEISRTLMKFKGLKFGQVTFKQDLF